MATKSLEEQLETALRQNAELRELLKEASMDFLTGLPERRQFEHRVNEEFSHIKRHHAAHHFAIFVMDLNHLKAVNDTHGHIAGDHMITEFGKLLKSLMRDYDMVARCGGDEFMAFLPEENKKSALLAKERLLAKFEEHRSSMMYFSGVAIGVASTSDGLGTFEELYNEADKDMYLHKEASREVLLLKRRE